MSCDNKLINPGNSWDDKFGGEIWFKQLTSQTMAEVRVKTPWGFSEYVAVGSRVINKTYTSGTHSYDVTLQLFVGTETTVLDAKTCYEALPTTGSIECIALASVDESELAATVYIDDVKFESLTPTTVHNVSVGTHTVKFTCEGAGSCLGFFDVEITVTVVAGQTVVATARMSTSTGKISCTSTPSNASIILGKVEPGQPIVYVPTLLFTDPDNPVVLSDIQQGNYSVKYFIEGYNSCTVDITVFAGGVAYAHCTLTEETNYGKIECSTNPTEATVFLEDLSLLVPFYVNHGTTNTTLENLIPGNYNLKITKDGYEDYITPVTVVKDVTTTVHKDLVQLLGFIRCQAYDSVTNAALNATIQIDGTTIAPTTPHTTAGLPPGSHTITFILEGYVTTSITVTVVAEETVDAYGSMVEEEEPVEPEVPGFDINVNVPNLLPGQDLDIISVLKIPFTDRWILDGHSKISWLNVSNRLYKARVGEGNSDPTPSYHNISTTNVRPNYAIIIGDKLSNLIIPMYFSEDVHPLTDSVTEVTITNQSIPPDWLFNLCDFFDVAEGDCIESFINTIPDLIFSAEDLSIITDGKSIYPPYDAKEPTAWNYAFAGLTFIPCGGAIKGVGKAGVKAVKGAKLFPDPVQNFIRNGRWQSAWYPEKQLTYLEVMWDVLPEHLLEISAKMEIGDITAADNLIKQYLPLDKMTDNSKNLGALTKELFDKLPQGTPETLIREAGLERLFTMEAGKVIYGKSPPTDAALNTIDELYNTFPRAKELMVDDAGKILKNTDATEEMIDRIVFATSNYTPIIDDLGTKTPIVDIDGMILNAVNKVGYENTPKLTKTLFTRSLKKTLEAPNPIKLTAPQITAIGNIIKTDPVGFANAMSEFDTTFKIKFIKSLELSGTDEALDTLSKAEGVMNVCRHSDIFSTFGYDIHDVAHAFTNHFTSMPDYWKSLGIDSIELAGDGKTIDGTPPYLTRYLAELAENKLSKEVADELVHRALMNDSIIKIVQKDTISSDEIISLNNLFSRYPIAADNAMKKIEPTDLAKFINILERTDEGKFTSEIFKVRDELIAKLGLDEADDVLNFWMTQLRTVTDDASRKSFLNRLSEEALTYPQKHPAKFIVMLITAIAGPIGLAEFILWRMKETLWDPPSFNLFKAIELEDKTSALDMLVTFKYLIEKYEPAFSLISYATPFSVTMMPDYILNTKLTHDLYADMLGVPEQKFFSAEYLLNESIVGTVTKILDGDTVDVDFEVLGFPEKGVDSVENSTVFKHNSNTILNGGSFQKGTLELPVRFLGINTPEDGSYTYSCTQVKQPYLVRRLLKPEDYCVNEELWHADEAFHIKTKEWIGQNLPKGHTATFKSDSSRQFDDHGRLLAVPFNDSGLNVCLASLRTGQSVVFFYDENKQVDTEEFLTFENIAKESNIGIWLLKDTGWIKFTSNPTAAEVFLDGVKIGNTVSSILMWETTLGTHTYEFKKVGYVGCTGTILEINKTHTEDNPYEKYCALELEEPTCPAPSASFVISPTSPDVNEAITFSASASTGGGDESIKSYSWDFGDGITGSGETVTHTYTTAGGYVSKLTVENSCGESDVSTKSISVKEIILTGSLTVKTYSAPDELLNGVVVYVDNIDKGTAAVTIKDLVIGSHTVRLEKTGYLGCTYCTGNNCNQGDRISPCEFYVTIENGITKVIEVTMQKVFEIDITSVPGGATISVDGTQVEMSVKGMNIIEQILAGRAKETDVDILFKKITELK